jgi:hypothetical protein
LIFSPKLIDSDPSAGFLNMLGKVTLDVNRTAQNISSRQCKKRWMNIYALTHMEEDERDMRRREVKPKEKKE